MTMGTEPDPEPPRQHLAAQTHAGERPGGADYWAHVDALAATMPTYSDEQLDRIARLFRGGRLGNPPGPSPAPEP